jgi:GNAT superfamily N-acetyltransferase
MSATLCPVPTLTAARVRAAHADAWQVLGVAGTAELDGVRLMATGLPHPQWNNGDVDKPAAVDIEAVRSWYDGVGVPWGMRLPAGAAWSHGRKLFTKRLMGLSRSAHQPPAYPDDVAIRVASTSDLEAYLHVDAIAFDEHPEVERPWLWLLLDHPAVTVLIAEMAGEVVASGHVAVSDGRAGPAGYVGGIAVLPHARRHGIGAALSDRLVQHAWDAGAELCHLHPDTDEDAGIYRRLGFGEVDGFDIYVDN